MGRGLSRGRDTSRLGPTLRWLAFGVSGILVIVALLVIRYEPLSTRDGTRLLTAASALLVLVSVRFTRRLRSEPTWALIVMLVTGVVSIAAGIVHIIIGAGLAAETGLWRDAVPWPAGLTTIGGTLIGFAGILWSLNRQESFASHERRVQERRRRVEEVEQSVNTVERAFDDAKRLSRESLTILRDSVEPLGHELLERSWVRRGRELPGLFAFFERSPSPERFDDGSVSRLGVRRNGHGWVPETPAELSEALRSFATADPIASRELNRRIDSCCEDLIARSREWRETYDELRVRLAASLEQSPIDLLPFADDLELLRGLIIVAEHARDEGSPPRVRSERQATVMHMAMVIASLARRVQQTDRTAEESFDGDAIASISPSRARGSGEEVLLGASVSRIAQLLTTERDRDANHRRYSDALVRDHESPERTLQVDWHWTDEFFEPYSGVVGDLDDEYRPSAVRDRLRREGSPIQTMIRALIAPGLRRWVIEHARASHQSLEREVDRLEGDTAVASVESGESPLADSIPTTRQFWDEIRGAAESRTIEFPRTPVIRTFGRAADERPADRLAGSSAAQIAAWSALRDGTTVPEAVRGDEPLDLGAGMSRAQASSTSTWRGLSTTENGEQLDDLDGHREIGWSTRGRGAQEIQEP